MKRSLRSWLWRVPIDQEVDEELAFHLEMRTRELIDRGVEPATARQMAAARMGDVRRLRRTCVDLGRKREREMRITQWLEELNDDVRFAVRQLRSAPGFAAVAVITLALGIGANSAIFALVDAVLLRPLPFRDPDRLVMIWEKSPSAERGLVSPLNLLDWSDQTRSFESLSGFIPSVGGMVMAGRDGTSETVSRQWVLSGFFDVLGVTPIAGRTFTADDNTRRASVAVISEPFWRTRFGGDPTVVGREIRFDGIPYTVVGVVAADAQLFGRTSMWAMVPVARRPSLRSVYAMHAIGRLKPGVTLDGAKADMAAIADGLARDNPATNKGRGVAMEPLHTAVIGGELRTTSMLFLGVVGFVLLICCANVASLLLARATVRSRELAVRAALGAGRSRVIRQLITESLVLSALGGGLGAVVGAATLAAAPALVPQGLLPPAVTLSFDVRVVSFCAAAAVLVGLLFGLAPAWQVTQASPAQSIASDSRAVTGRGGRMRSILVVGEVATAVVLLFGAGLLLRTLIAVDTIDRGYRADQVLTMMVDPLGSKYPSPGALLRFFDEIEHEVTPLPGVGGVAWSTGVPLGASEPDSRSFEIAGDAVAAEHERPQAEYQIVSSGYFDTVEIPIVAGRSFAASDRDNTTPVCIVNEAFARTYLRGRSPIGVRVALRPVDAPQATAIVREIVGVARQVKGRPDETRDVVQIYVPLAQDATDDIYLLVRAASGRAEALAASVRAGIGRVDKEQLVSVRDVMTLNDVAWDATSRHRFRAVLVMTLAGLALLLAMVGVFGILAYSVQQRTRDLGLRRALGATTRDVLGLVVADAVRVIASGAVVGLAVSAALGRLLTTVLFGVEPHDAMTYVSVTLVLAVTAALSIAAPAWRATRIDPVTALRSE
jgi:predicted permease